MAKQYGSKWEYLRFLLFAHILNPLWKDRVARRARRNYYNYRRVAAYLKKYDAFVRGLEVTPRPSSATLPSTAPRPFTSPCPSAEGHGEERLFSIWWQGEENAPELVSICFERLRKAYGDRFVVLDDTTIRDWVDLPDYIWAKWKEGKIPRANFADICRIALLVQHGGMWFDATNFLTSPVPRWIEDEEVFIFRDGPRFTPEKFIQICFLRAKKGNPLFKAWLDFILKYWKTEDEIIDYFLHQFMMRFLVDNNEGVRKLFYEMPQVPQTPTHLLWHLHVNDPYSDELYTECTKDTFFQKTTYKFKAATDPIPGSVADYIVNRRIPDVINE